MGGMTWSRSFMLVLFQTFLMMVRSSSLACSKLPGAADRPGQQHLTGPPLAQQTWPAFPCGGGCPGHRLCWGQPSLRSHLPQALASSTQSGRLQRLPPCPPCRPRTVTNPLHTWSALPPPGSPPCAWPRPLPDPALLSLPSRGSLPCRCHPHPVCLSSCLTSPGPRPLTPTLLPPAPPPSELAV